MPSGIDYADLTLLRLGVRAQEDLQGLLGIVTPLQQVEPVATEERIDSRLGGYCPDTRAGVRDQNPHGGELCAGGYPEHAGGGIVGGDRESVLVQRGWRLYQFQTPW